LNCSYLQFKSRVGDVSLRYCIVKTVPRAHSRPGKFRKVSENLYRYSSNGIYYAIFRDRGKLKSKSLKTTDRAL
jgi:hypothetical protein